MLDKEMDPTPKIHAPRNPRRTRVARMYGNEPCSQSPRNHRGTPKHRDRTPRSGKGNHPRNKTSDKNNEAKIKNTKIKKTNQIFFITPKTPHNSHLPGTTNSTPSWGGGTPSGTPGTTNSTPSWGGGTPGGTPGTTNKTKFPSWGGRNPRRNPQRNPLTVVRGRNPFYTCAPSPPLPIP